MDFPGPFETIGLAALVSTDAEPERESAINLTSTPYLMRSAAAFAAQEETEMMTLPADEDYARAMLTLFGEKRLRPRQSLNFDSVRTEFFCHNFGRSFDYEAAVEYAAVRGWITLELGSIRLTEAGFAEM